MGRGLLITGSSGIAAATARLATSRGETVFLIGKNRQECARRSSELNGSSYSVADVADENAVKEAINLCLRRMHAIDAAFHVAGGLIHLLLLLAVISLVVHFVTGRSAV